MSLPSNRYRHVEEWLYSFVQGEGAKLNILETGAGAGQYAHIFADHDYFGTDIPETWYEFEVQPTVFASVDCLPFQSGVFDIVFSVAAFDYFPDPVRALRECKRVLKANGKLVVFTYCKRTLEEIHTRCLNEKGSVMHSQHHVFDDRKMGQLIREAGLVGTRIPYRPYENYFRRLWRRLNPPIHRTYLLENPS